MKARIAGMGAGLVALLASACLPVTGTPGAEADPSTDEHPVNYSGAAALLHAEQNPDTPPAGANDWSCQPSEAHPNPVVLVHGTVENMTYNWYTLSPLLANYGYCVFALNYGQEPGTWHLGLPGSETPGGTAPVAESAVELKGFVNEVLAETGAEKVDIVGHSQGGMMPRWYMKFLGGASKVDKLVGLAPSNHGSTFLGLNKLPGVPELTAMGLGQAVLDQQYDSEFMAELNEGGDTLPGITYTVIATRYDEIVTPYQSQFLDGEKVTNILLQDHCPLNLSEHLAINFDRTALGFVLGALDPDNAAQPVCGLALPFIGG